MTGERLSWRRTFEPEHEDFVALGPDGSYARIYFNISAPGAKHRWLWFVAVQQHYTENGSAETKQEAADKATESYWRQFAKAKAAKA